MLVQFETINNRKGVGIKTRGYEFAYRVYVLTSINNSPSFF